MTHAPAPARPAPVVASSPYPWPYHGHLDPTRCALVCCLDRSWRSPSGPEGDEADARLAELAERLSALGGIVVAVTATPAGRGRAHPHNATTTAPGRRGSVDLPVRPHLVLEAAGTSAFYGSPLDALLREAGRSDLLLAGWGLEGPVHSTLRAANDRGYECLLVPDASRSVDPDLVAAACSTVCMSGGIFGAVAPTRDTLRALAVLSPTDASPADASPAASPAGVALPGDVATTYERMPS